MTFREIILEIVARPGWDQGKLAEALGTTQQTISNVKNGAPVIEVHFQMFKKILSVCTQLGIELNLYTPLGVPERSVGNVNKGNPDQNYGKIPLDPKEAKKVRSIVEIHGYDLENLSPEGFKYLEALIERKSRQGGAANHALVAERFEDYKEHPDRSSSHDKTGSDKKRKR